MSFERGFSKPRIHAERESSDHDLESEDADGVDEFMPDQDISEQPEISVEDTQTSARQELRAFTKEHSQYYRDQLARRIKGMRSYFRNVRRPELLTEASSTQEAVEMWEGERDIQSEQLGQLENQKGDIEALRADVERLEEEVEAVKSSFWKPIFRRDELSKLNTRLILLRHKKNISDFDYERIVEKIKLEGEKLKKSKELITAGNSTLSDLESTVFYEEDELVVDTKKMISNFYTRNAQIRNHEEENPGVRDVMKLSLENATLLKHAIVDPADSAEGRFLDSSASNNDIVRTPELNPSQRINLAVSLEPMLSTHTEGPFRKGLIIGGGEVMSAYNADAATVAVSFDERVSKRDEGRASSLMLNIQERFKTAINEPDGYGTEKWNEILVRHPKFSALYVKSNGEFGKKDSFGRNKFFKSAKWALEESIRLGIPAVVELDSGEYVNLATDEVVTKEEILSYTGTYSPGERAQLFSEAQIGQDKPFKREVDIEGRIKAVSERDHDKAENINDSKRLAREMAQARLDLLLAEEEIVAQQLIRDYGTTDVSSYLDN